MTCKCENVFLLQFFLFAKYAFLNRPNPPLPVDVKAFFFFAIYGRFIEIGAHFEVHGNAAIIFTATNSNQKNRSLEKLIIKGS